MSNTPFELTPFDDGYVEEPPAPEPPSRIELLARRRRGDPGPVERVCLQLGHRLAIAATLLLCGAVTTTLMRHDAYWHLLLLTFITADLALLCGVLAAWFQHSRPRRLREPLGIVLFSLLLLLPTIVLTVLAKFERLSPLVARILGES